MDVARRLRDRGAAVVFVSHRLDEVFALCDRYTVMRDGATVAVGMVADSSPAEIVRLMVGRPLAEFFPKLPAALGATVLAVEGLGRTGQFEDVSFEVRAGEIVALAGLVGSGRSEVVRAVFGIDRYDAGRVLLHGQPLPPGDPRAAISRGVALVPEDRRQQGLLMQASIARNVALTVLGRLSRHLLVRSAAERKVAAQWAETLQLRHAGLDAPVERLSGGNQQKVVLAKWLATEPKLLVIDEPTRGIDVGTKAEVHRMLGELAARGLAVLMISSELPEVLGIADRVLVMREGLLVQEIARADATQERIMLAATGQATAS
jgi:rhamnose transport system ATP-binding protein